MIPRSIFSEEHEMYRDVVRRFVKAEMSPNQAAWEKAGCVPRDIWLKSGAAGLLCPSAPEAYGGAGGDFLFNVVVDEEMMRAGASGPGFSLHNDITYPYLEHHGTEAQKERWIPRMVSGETITAIAMSEPDAGSDLQGVKTTAVRDGDHYVINGSKTFITNGQLCDLVVVVAKTDPTTGAHGISLFLVEADRPGFVRGRTSWPAACRHPARWTSFAAPRATRPAPSSTGGRCRTATPASRARSRTP